MTALQPVFSIQPRIICRTYPGHKIFSGLISFVPQASSYDLFYFSIMYINAWSKPHHCSSSFSLLFSVTDAGDLPGLSQIFSGKWDVRSMGHPIYS